MSTRSTRLLDDTFKISIILKGLFALLETVGGVLLLAVNPTTINHLTLRLTTQELSRDPQDFLAVHLRTAGQQLATGSRYFGAFYLLSHGVVKLVIIVALLLNKIWAYPWMIVLLLSFIAYQLYRLNYKYSLGLLLLTVFDVFIIWLTWLEYKKQRHRIGATD